MSGSAINIPIGDGRSFDGYLAVPAAGSGPGIVLFTEVAAEAEGRGWAELYAAEGYLVLCAPTPNSGGDAATIVARLRDRIECSGKLATLGFGRGSLAVLRAAAQAQVECVVFYYPSDIQAVLDQAVRIACPVMLHLAGSDPANSPEATARLREAFTDPASALTLGSERDLPDRRAKGAVYTYPGAAPGFAHRDRPHFDRAAAGLAHSRTIALLRRLMGPNYDLEALWEAHTSYEFETRDVDATMATMVDDPYVNHVPVMTGGVGRRDLARFYANHFIPKCPADTVMAPISRTVGADRVVDEMVVSFTHDVEIDWMLPGVAPTGKRVEVPLVAIVGFRGDKLYHEHIYWDQASVLVQIGLLDADGLPVAGAETAKKLLDESLPSNTLMTRWADSAPPGG
jgi:carboxymethylenebutenolidase